MRSAMHRIGVAWMIPAAVALAPTDARAQVTFDGYQVGPIAGHAAQADALTGNWRSDHTTDGFVVAAGSLSLDGEPGDGGRLLVQPTGRTLSIGIDAEAGPLADLLHDDGTAIVNRPIYVSFLCRAHGTAVEAAQGWLGFAGANGFEYVVGQTWQQAAFSNMRGQPSTIPLDTDTHRIVLKIGRYAWGNQVDVYVDPDPAQAESAQTVDIQGWPGGEDTPVELDELRFKANGNAWSFDDIRFGPSFASVLAEPAGDPQ